MIRPRGKTDFGCRRILLQLNSSRRMLLFSALREQNRRRITLLFAELGLGE
jgi:hypothetical protein